MAEARIATSDVTVDLPKMRVSYEVGTLSEAELASTWHDQLQEWLDDAIRAAAPEPNAMVLATANADGMPASRTVLAKGLDERGVVFFTNYASAKSHDLMATRFASAT
ncbi:MAG TPA: pyridoxamine 5'-phosphate oxidase family protein, partial [Amycolatopsis sp.]|nr:pyridoxamine 5'-phosphate oxidase family protein [Amycolatopsis sp.]